MTEIETFNTNFCGSFFISQLMMAHTMVEIIQQFLAPLVLIILFSQKFQKHLSIVKINNSLDITQVMCEF